jgi:hypothetical protein
MSQAKSPTQILLAWRENRWVVARNAVEVGAYAYRNHAMDMVRRLAAEIAAEGLDCYLLVREPDGRWIERPCPRTRSPEDRSED